MVQLPHLKKLRGGIEYATQTLRLSFVQFESSKEDSCTMELHVSSSTL